MALGPPPPDGLKARLKTGEVTACHWLALGSPALAELAAEAAPDAIVFDLQHGLWDRAGLEAAIGLVGDRTQPLVRTADQSASAIGAALDAGAHGIIAPLVNSAQECEGVVAQALYPPLGRRSAGGVRSLADFAAYSTAANANLLIAVMIETVQGVAAAEDIAATPGLNMIFIGPGDLSLALGEAAGSPVFEAALARILAAGRGAGVAVGIFTPSLDIALARAAQGFQFVVFADDVDLNRRGSKILWDRFRAGTPSRRL